MRAVILGGTGAIGGAVAARLAAAGWSVDVTGRDPGSMPPELVAAGVRFHQVQRSETSTIGRLEGDGADLLVDLLAYRGADVRALIETVGGKPGQRLLNSADPDTPSAEQIVHRIGERLNWDGTLELLDGKAGPTAGDHPWRSAHPFVLSTTASERLGYSPEGGAVELLTQEVDWIAEPISVR